MNEIVVKIHTSLFSSQLPAAVNIYLQGSLSSDM